MITKIEINGFKGFFNFSLYLQPFQVIVGPNAAGKSNLFDALLLLSRLAGTDIRSAFQEVRGESGELFTFLPNGKTINKMEFAVELLLDKEVTDQWGRTEEIIHSRVRYELHIARTHDSRGLEQLKIVHETLTPIRAMDDVWARNNKRVGDWVSYFQYRRRREAPFISSLSSNGIPTLTLHQDGRSGRQRQSVLEKLESSFLSSLNNAEFPHGFAVREELKNWTFLQLNPESLRLPASRLAPERIDPSGQYLSNMLARLEKEDQYLLTDICTDLSNLVPGIVRVEVEEDEARDRYMVWAKTSDGRKFSSRVLSDGTLRMLALASLKNDPQQGGVLLFEEPENGVHPFRIKQLVPLLREMTTQFDPDSTPEGKLRQLLINTHSPTLVSQLEDKEMVFADVANLIIEDIGKPMRVTRMTPVRDEIISTGDTYTRLEMLRYLDESDLEAAAGRIKGELQ
ncbi:ATP-binding protein [Paenibacillus sp. TRM 82003]|nr:ATP-binding protein [Paenibacillus sp. TRM 82003]